MAESVPNRLRSLPGLSKPELSLLWKQVFQTTSPPGIGKGLLVRILAHRLQEQCYGGLSGNRRGRLRELARGLEKGSISSINVKPGTRFIREWRGQTHVVGVEEKGYEYKGARYESLSKIARTITGTRWSGPLFFGLKHSPRNH